MTDEKKKLVSMIAKAYRGDESAIHKTLQDSAVNLLQKLACETPSDVYGAVSSNPDKADAEWWSLLQTGDVKDNLIIWARTKSLWRACQAYVIKDAGTSSLPTSTNTESFLDPVDATELDRAWLHRYTAPIDVMMMPEDRFKGKVYKEFKSKLPTHIKINKVRSLCMSHKPDDSTSQQLAPNIELRLKDGGEVVIRDIHDYFEGLRILSNAYSFCGNYKQLGQDNKEIDFSPKAVNDDYVNGSYRAANRLDGTEHIKLSWLRGNDHKTRGIMISLMRRGWIQGKALTQARLETAVDWRIGASGHKVVDIDIDDDRPPPKRQRTRARRNRDSLRRNNNDRRGQQTQRPRSPPRRSTRDSRGGGGKGGDKGGKGSNRADPVKTGIHHDGKAICKGYNDGRCITKENQCKHKQLHVCDVLANGSKVCGSRSHTRKNHR